MSDRQRQEQMQETSGRRTWRRHLVYLAAFSMDFASSSGSVAAVYVAKGKYQATPAQLGLYALLAGVTYVCSSFLFGRMSDRWGRRPNIVLACALCITGYLLVPWTGTLWQLYGLMMVCCCGQGIFWPTIAADISDHSTPVELSHRLGRFNLSWGLGFFSGSFFGGWCGQEFGQSRVFGVAMSFAATALLLHLFRTFAPERIRPGPAEEMPGDHAAALTSLLWKMSLLVNFVAPGLAATVRVHMPTVTGGEHSALGGFYSAMLFFAQWVAFLVLARWHGWRFRFAPVAAAYALLLAGAAVCGFSGGTSVFGAGCLLIGSGLGVSASLSLYYSMAATTNRGQRGGIHEGVLSTGASAIPYLGGLVATTPLTAMFPWPNGIPHLTAGVFVLSAFLLALRLYTRSRRRWACSPLRVGIRTGGGQGTDRPA